MLYRKKSNGRIFINYRRSDSQGFAGRLSDSLESYFGDNRVFRDIEDIAGGAEFAKTIEANLHAADAMIILIGPGWLTAGNGDGKRRLDHPDDWVVQEIAVAIQKGVRGAPMTPTVARQVLRLFNNKGSSSKANDNFDLTTREVEILGYLVKGMSYKMVAETCFVSFATISTHVRHIYEKLQVHSVSAAVAKALENRIV